MSASLYASFPSFAAAFARSEKAGVPRYLLLLNVAPDAAEAVGVLREAIDRSGMDIDEEIAALLAQDDWRPQLVGAVSALVAGGSEEQLAALWGAIDRPCWTSPQLVAAASLADPGFDTKARERLDRRGALDGRRAEAMPWPMRHSALGPGSLEDHAAKVVSALLRVCESRVSASGWAPEYLANPELQRILARDVDGGGDIAVGWARRIRPLVQA